MWPFSIELYEENWGVEEVVGLEEIVNFYLLPFIFHLFIVNNGVRINIYIYILILLDKNEVN